MASAHLPDMASTHLLDMASARLSDMASARLSDMATLHLPEHLHLYPNAGVVLPGRVLQRERAVRRDCTSRHDRNGDF